MASIREREESETKYESKLEEIKKKYERIANPESVSDEMDKLAGNYNKHRDTTDMLCEFVKTMLAAVKEYELTNAHPKGN